MSDKTKIQKWPLRIFLIFLAGMFTFFQLSPPLADALSKAQKDLYRQNILYYDYEVPADPCGTNADTSATPGTGAPDGLEFPNLDPAKMADAIDKYIEDHNKTSGFTSVFTGMGETFVSGAKNSNINPFLLVVLALHETQLGKPDDFNVRHGNNAFGRTATTSQPNFRGDRLWYYWSSVKASIDNTAPENANTKSGDMASYLRNSGNYDDALKTNDMIKLMMTYAPPFENETDKYIKQNKDNIATLVRLAGSSPSSGSGGVTSDPAAAQTCCADASASTTPGRTNEEKVWNFLVSEMGLNDNQAAAVMGNMQQESGFRTDALNPSSKAYGIAQWYAGRKTALENFAKSLNKPVNNIDVQLQFLKKELESSYKSSVLDPIKASSTLAEATRIWLERFEVPCLPGSAACDKEMNIRVPNAQNWLGKFGNGNASTETASADTSCNDTSGTTAGANGVKVGDLAWPVPVKWVNSNFEWFTKPHHDHPSSDIPVPEGTDVYSITPGKVLAVNQTGYGSGYGTFVTIEYKSALFRYQHGVENSIKVKVGDSVEAGQLIMKSGHTGYVYPPGPGGSHLHVSIETGGGGTTMRSTQHCPQTLFQDMKDGKSVTSFNSLPTTGCIGASLN